MNAITVTRNDVIDIEKPDLLEDSRALAARFQIMHEQTMRELDEALKEARIGTATYLNHLIAREKLEANYISTLMELGLITRAPANYYVEKFEFKSTVGLMPQSGRDTTMFDPPTIDAE
jgi:hypothetical protein